MRDKKSSSQLLASLAWIAFGTAIAYFGRRVLDWVILLAPEKAGLIEHFGGGVIGFLIVIVALIPMLRMYGVLGKDGKSDS